jgi:putative oxidoreductase
LILGLATPLAVASLSGVLTAIRTVHWKNGPWATRGGYEHNVVMLAALLTIADLGPGRLSLDAAFGRQRSGALLALAALGAGAIGSALAVEQGRRTATAA